MTISVTKVNGDVVVPYGGNAVAYLGKGDSPTETINAFNAPLAGGSRTATIDKRYITYFWFFLTPGVVCENLQVQIQLEPGSTATAYPIAARRLPLRWGRRCMVERWTQIRGR